MAPKVKQTTLKQDFKVRHVCGTWNNPPDDEVVVAILKDKRVKYYVFGEELGEKLATRHFQMYVEFGQYQGDTLGGATRNPQRSL